LPKGLIEFANGCSIKPLYPVSNVDFFFVFLHFLAFNVNLWNRSLTSSNVSERVWTCQKCNNNNKKYKKCLFFEHHLYLHHFIMNIKPSWLIFLMYSFFMLWCISDSLIFVWSAIASIKKMNCTIKNAYPNRSVVKLGYNDHGYSKITAITNEFSPNLWSLITGLQHKFSLF